MRLGLPRSAAVVVLNLMLLSCSLPVTSPNRPTVPFFQGSVANLAVTNTNIITPSACTNQFVTHTLDYTTTVAESDIRLFESNGTGVALGDLNDDGLIDLAFANLDGPSAVFWNQGGLRFRKQSLDDTNGRGVQMVDIDGDNQLELVFSHRAAGLTTWQVDQDGELRRVQLIHTTLPVYAMAWGDLNGDQQLDLVTASYDAEIDQHLRSSFLFNKQTGVMVYFRNHDRYHSQRLADSAQALAIALPDLNGDFQPDIWIGNDFKFPDQFWINQAGQFEATQPFPITAESTMSIDQGDINNDGRFEYFAADMKPYDVRPTTFAAWLPLMNKMSPSRAADNLQRIENVLLMRNDDGSYTNQAHRRGVDASGWSWSSKFGDLDNDGWQDLYVVNGMIAKELFGHLPNAELVEQNQAFRNDQGSFQLQPTWQLGSEFSGRGMSMADLDNDGDLEIVVNNLRGPAQLFENQLCNGDALTVELRWPSSGNTRALGALLALHTSQGILYREVRAGSGYLSGDTSRVHFGLGRQHSIGPLEIRWPDGRVSIVDQPIPQTHMQIVREAEQP